MQSIVLEKTLVAVMPRANECRSQICESLMLFGSTRWKRKKPLRIVRLEFVPSMRLLARVSCASSRAKQTERKVAFISCIAEAVPTSLH
jgi:hypothetical protein